ncbi:MAG: response regulator [Candidatus Cloacimonetes bacterium]|nr:response regulator [Candidatus Cloacimonadota bacterium]HOH78549.1 response regulator [Candidatus Cloacimonadota bacterium]
MILDSQASVLVIDDDPHLLELIREQLSESGEYLVVALSDPKEGLAWLMDNQVEVVISDIHMPGMSGIDLIDHIKLYNSSIQVILITGYPDNAYMRSAIKAGVFDFLRKPFPITELLVSVKQAREKYLLLTQNLKYQTELELMVVERTRQLHEANLKLESHYINTLRAMVNAIEAKDVYTKGHSERVTALSMVLGKSMGLSEEELRILRLGSLLHDLGKIGVYKTVLDKATSLSDAEYELVRHHPLIGARIIEPIGLPKEVGMVILQHHEWYNGTGYPFGMVGPEIHPLAKIVAITDAFDAMTSKRPYRPQLDYEQAAKEIERQLEVQFDPNIGQTFCSNLQELTAILSNPNGLSDYVFGADTQPA